MTKKRFRSGFAKYDEFSDEIIDELTGKHYFDSTKDDYVFSEEIVNLLNELYEENKNLKKLFETAHMLIMAHCDADVKESWVNFKYGDFK